MARTAAGAALTRRHRVSQLTVRAAALRDTTRLFAGVDPTNLRGTIDRFAGVAASLAQARHGQSAALGADYFERFRAVEGVGGSVRARAARSPSRDELVAQLRGSALSGIINARRAGFSPQSATRNGLVKAAGKMTLLVLAGGRDSVMESAVADPRAQRWQRVTAAEPCAFCAMIASRGAVFLSEGTADFEAHDHCGCVPEVAYEGSALPPSSVPLRERWERLTAGLSGGDALAAYRRGDAPAAAGE